MENIIMKPAENKQEAEPHRAARHESAFPWLRSPLPHSSYKSRRQVNNRRNQNSGRVTQYGSRYNARREELLESQDEAAA